ncbi:DUF4134 domain-containing protein [Mucilaginibacter rubeus]|uniref:DUF4134 domain-containing protein n=1 Tax=Mucilaginibacter rubeus TaxID=2027860 RepID=A0AAE6MIS1_9SPHI|nr:MULTISPECIES: DUF4134 family protein [Mucilaginibacter]QEM04941.1 DUF4134 domain-containing protein [Mucilaginibacter rubeus]QEM17535.1 DUF4134 domain-containing protein [Mucilaginibacter gossypii]QTE45944.1 DUF4134 domain-containing protein [Mucilaginibacter rubeus]QTE52541.1 DUF4134 domain-containing protein [Mucilaginibacter rubeus]QTE57630.1 DUF4134 domain-containing protein [Mucilaginibacter rubeus]
MRYLLIFCCCLLSSGATAQPGITEMQQAQQNLKSDFFSALDCALVLAAIFGIVGAVRIYHNWQMGHPRIDEQVAAWFFASFFMMLAGVFLKAVFGL